MGDFAIKSEGIGKVYSLKTFRSYKDALPLVLEAFSQPQEDSKRHWAIEDITFELAEGKILGLLGHNGAGKSTLLKVIARITAPTQGILRFRGRIGSLLEASVGFHPELTGRENIFLSGVTLGMKEKEISSQFDEIVEFADIGKFLDVPVKRYSSGMSVRLGFSVAAHMRQDILLVDEVLAVGDMAFQARSLARLKSLTKDGRTVIFVSHNLSSVAELCDLGLYLEKGRQKFMGGISEAVDLYRTDLAQSTGSEAIRTVDTQMRTVEERKVSIEKVLVDGALEFARPYGRSLQLNFTVESQADLDDVRIFIRFHDFSGRYVGACHCEELFAFKAGERSDFNLLIEDFNLGPGTYNIQLSLGKTSGREEKFFDSVDVRPAFEITWPETALAFERNAFGDYPAVIFTNVNLSKLAST